MFQIYASQKLVDTNRFQRHIHCDKIINSDYFGNPSSERRLANFPSRSRSLKKTQLSAEKSSTKVKRNIERQNQDKSSISRTKEGTNCYELKNNFKRLDSKEKNLQKHRTIKKLMSFPTANNNSLKKLQRANSHQRIQQYFEPYKSSQKQKNRKKSIIHNQLEKKAIESYNQIKTTKISINPGNKKKQIQEFLIKSTKNIYFAQQQTLNKPIESKSPKNIKFKQISINLQNKQNDSLIDISNNVSEFIGNNTKGSITQILVNHINIFDTEKQTKEIKLLSSPKLNNVNKDSQTIFNTDSSNFLKLESNLGRFKSNNLHKNQHQTPYYTKTIQKINNSNNQLKQTNFEDKVINNAVIESIQTHIAIIDSLAEFVVTTEQYYNNENEYNYECFLLYKKFFIERLKIQNSLNGNGNCFILKHIEVKSQALVQACKSPQILEIQKVFQVQNLEIEQSLQQNYKSQYDTDIHNMNSKQFTKLIIVELNKQFTKLMKSKNIKVQNQQQIEYRIMRIIQISFLMEQLQRNNGKPYLQCQITKDFSDFMKLNNIDYQNLIKKYI